MSDRNTFESGAMDDSFPVGPEECMNLLREARAYIVGLDTPKADGLLARIDANLDSGMIIPIGYAQEMHGTQKMLLMETRLPREEIHDSGRPMYRLYRSEKTLPALGTRKK